MKDLYLFLKHFKFQGAVSVLRVDFAQSKWPHFHRVYLVTVCKRSFIAVSLSATPSLGQIKSPHFQKLEESIHLWIHLPNLRFLQLISNFCFCNRSKRCTANLCCPFIQSKICRQTCQLFNIIANILSFVLRELLFE